MACEVSVSVSVAVTVLASEALADAVLVSVPAAEDATAAVTT